MFLIKAFSLKSVLMTVLSILILVTGWSGMKSILHDYVEDSLGAEISSNTFAHFLFVGLHPDGNGYINDTTRKYVDYVLKTNFDFEKADELTYEELKEAIDKAGKKKMLNLFVKKIQDEWKNDIHPQAFLEQYWEPSETITNIHTRDKILSYAKTASQFAYLILIMFTAVGSIVCLLYYRDNKALLFINLYIFGFAALLIISEIQSRYKCIIIPFMMITSAIGIRFTLSKTSLLISKVISFISKKRLASKKQL